MIFCRGLSLKSEEQNEDFFSSKWLNNSVHKSVGVGLFSIYSHPQVFSSILRDESYTDSVQFVFKRFITQATRRTV